MDRTWKILAADDETELLDTLELFLKKENMLLIKAADGEEAFRQFKAAQPDLVLLDVMMPGMDGFAVLERIRRESKIPAIMVTARIQDYDKILGLTMGADDYITKPYNPLELVARIKAQLRRNYDYNDGETRASSVIQMFHLELDRFRHVLKRDGTVVELTGTEYKMLDLLMSSPGRIFTKQQIVNAVWDSPYGADDSTIMVHISNLRSKIERNPHRPEIIKTIKGLGYRFEVEDGR